jgi:regulator of RNase E activity RraA
VVVGDAEGVIVIPAEIADEIAAEAAEMTVCADGRDDAVGRIPAQRPVFCRQAAKSAFARSSISG